MYGLVTVLCVTYAVRYFVGDVVVTWCVSVSFFERDIREMDTLVGPVSIHVSGRCATSHRSRRTRPIVAPSQEAALQFGDRSGIENEAGRYRTAHLLPSKLLGDAAHAAAVLTSHFPHSTIPEADFRGQSGIAQPWNRWEPFTTTPSTSIHSSTAGTALQPKQAPALRRMGGGDDRAISVLPQVLAFDDARAGTTRLEGEGGPGGADHGDSAAALHDHYNTTVSSVDAKRLNSIEPGGGWTKTQPPPKTSTSPTFELAPPGRYLHARYDL